MITFIDDPDWRVEDPHISPDRTKIIVRAGIIGVGTFTYVIGINGTNPPLTKVTDPLLTQSGIGTWYSDSEYLAYSGGTGSDASDIYKVKYDGTEHILIFDQSLVSRLWVGCPIIDIVNSRYAFMAGDAAGTNNDVYTVDFDLSNPLKIIDLYSGPVNWSPDGNKLIYNYWTGIWNFRYCDADGSNSTQIPNLGDVEYQCFSPDMQYILYYSAASLYKADFPTGTNPIILANNIPQADYSADWK